MGILGNRPYAISNEEYAINKTIPENKKFAIITPIILSRITIGRKVKTTPEHEHIIFNKIACIILNLKNFVKGTEPRAQTINTQTIKMNISRLLSV